MAICVSCFCLLTWASLVLMCKFSHQKIDVFYDFDSVRMDIHKTLRDFPDGTEIQYTMKYKRLERLITAIIKNGEIVSSFGTFRYPQPFLDAIHKHIKEDERAVARASGWKVLYYKKNGEWVSLNEFYNNGPLVSSSLSKRGPESYKSVTVGTATQTVNTEVATETTVIKETETAQPVKVEKEIQTEVAQHSKAVQVGNSMKPSDLPSGVLFVQEEPLSRCSLIEQKTGAYALLHPKIVSLPFNIGWAWVDSMGHAWEAVPTDHPNVCFVGKYIGIYYEKEEYLALKILPSFPRIPPPEVRMFHTTFSQS